MTSDPRETSVTIQDEGDRKAAQGPRKMGSVPKETKRLLSGEGTERTLASGVRSKTRTTASSGAVCADTCDLFEYLY